MIEIQQHAKKHQDDLKLIKFERNREKTEIEQNLNNNHHRVLSVPKTKFMIAVEQEEKDYKEKLLKDKELKKLT